MMSQLWACERAAHRVESPLPKRQCRTRPGILGHRTWPLQSDESLSLLRTCGEWHTRDPACLNPLILRIIGLPYGVAVLPTALESPLVYACELWVFAMCPALRGSTVSHAGDTHFPKHTHFLSVYFFSIDP